MSILVISGCGDNYNESRIGGADSETQIVVVNGELANKTKMQTLYFPKWF